jgi:hypothetical protein
VPSANRRRIRPSYLLLLCCLCCYLLAVIFTQYLFCLVRVILHYLQEQGQVGFGRQGEIAPIFGHCFKNRLCHLVGCEHDLHVESL